jgi:hypothetical protein
MYATPPPQGDGSMRNTCGIGRSTRGPGVPPRAGHARRERGACPLAARVSPNSGQSRSGVSVTCVRLAAQMNVGHRSVPSLWRAARPVPSVSAVYLWLWPVSLRHRCKRLRRAPGCWMASGDVLCRQVRDSGLWILPVTTARQGRLLARIQNPPNLLPALRNFLSIKKEHSTTTSRHACLLPRGTTEPCGYSEDVRHF